MAFNVNEILQRAHKSKLNQLKKLELLTKYKSVTNFLLDFEYLLGLHNHKSTEKLCKNLMIYVFSLQDEGSELLPTVW